MRRLLILLLSAALWSPAEAAAKTRPAANAAAARQTIHTVYQGQTLAMIAKRYNVSVEALCAANEISLRSPIKPGQKLQVPDKNAPAGPSPARVATAAEKPAAARSTPAEKATSALSEQPKTHLLAQQKLQVQAAQATRASGKPAGPSWRKYVRPARRAGYVVLKATGRQWQGYALVKGNRISPAGRRGFKRALYSWRTGAEVEIDARLIRLLVQLSDTFGGRPLKVVSGYRENSYARESKHKSGHACDLSVEGVPNDVLRDYLMTFDQVGVGYYPNSSFVHVDVRASSTHWVDRSAPGERPEYEHAVSR